MRIVFASPPAYGHLYPLLPLALAAVEAGHEVTVATGAPFLDRLPVPTVPLLPAESTMPALRELTRHNHPELDTSTIDGIIEFGGRMFGHTLPRAVVPVLLDVLTRVRPDLVVYECNNVGAAIAADLLGIRAVAFGVGAATEVFQDWHRIAVEDQRDRWASGRPGDLASYPGGYLDPVPRSLYRDWPLPPPNRLPVRPVSWSEPAPLPAILSGPARRPRVYVTLGTVAYGAVDVLRRAVTETAAHDVDVLVAVGPDGDPAALGELPRNVYLARFVPQAEVLRRVHLVVHHGGAGTMLGALASAVPQFVLPQGADQPLNATLVERAGAGSALRGDALVPGAIAATVATLLQDGPQRVVAKQFATEIAALPTPAEVIPALTR
ncbi:MAG: glycosyltransferase [Labedaea sp.]